MIHVEGLCKRFGRTVAIEGVSFRVERVEGALDELASPDTVRQRSLEVARKLQQIPAGGYAKVKAQLREPALAAMRPALDGGAEPELGGWVSEEARSAALKVLAGTG